VLSAAAGEVTRELAPGSVELRLRGREPSFVVTTPATRPAEPDPAPLVSPEGATARINFRLGEHLKSRIEDAAGEAGLSVNAWLGRAATAALESGERRPQRRVGQRFTGWVR
jgi:hypothetical protein